jgi:spore germination cell wall hydrolase CwlJ-like protein
MNAVDILENVEKYFDRHHSFYVMWGGLFALIFFGIYIPFTIHHKVMEKVQAQQMANVYLVAQMDDMNNRMEFMELSYEKKQKVMREVECLAKNIYFEAGGEPYAGKVAVAQVTMNRVKSNDYPRSVCGVVYQKRRGVCQFSWVCEGKSNPRNNSTWRESLKIAENILINKREYNVVGRAMYFHAVYVDPAWSETKRVVKKIGNHIFYH